MASRMAYSTWTPQKPTLFDGHYLRNRSTLDIGVLGYIGIVQHKEHTPEVLSIPPGTSCISLAAFSIWRGFCMSDQKRLEPPRTTVISAAQNSWVQFKANLHTTIQCRHVVVSKEASNAPIMGRLCIMLNSPY